MVEKKNIIRSTIDFLAKCVRYFLSGSPIMLLGKQSFHFCKQTSPMELKSANQLSCKGKRQRAKDKSGEMCKMVEKGQERVKRGKMGGGDEMGVTGENN